MNPHAILFQKAFLTTIGKRKINLCSQGYRDIRSIVTLDDIKDCFVKYLDFCIENRNLLFPILEKIDLSEIGLISNKNVSNILYSQYIAIGGCSYGTIDCYKNYDIGCLYVAQSSIIEIKARDFAQVLVNIYDDARVYVAPEYRNQVKIINHYEQNML